MLAPPPRRLISILEGRIDLPPIPEESNLRKNESRGEGGKKEALARLEGESILGAGGSGGNLGGFGRNEKKIQRRVRLIYTIIT